MAGPYGITQFDAAGVLNNYQQMQENRIRSMILEKQMANEEHKAKVQSGIASAVSRYAQGGKSETGAIPKAGGADAAASAYAPDPLAPLPDASQASPPQAAAPRGPSAGDREALFNELMALDYETAGSVMDAFAKMDKATASASADKNLRLMQIAAGIMQLPAEQRRQAVQQASEELQGLGFKPEQLAGFDPTDANLRQIVAQGMDMERIVKFVQPDLHSVPQGGSLVETGPSGGSRTVFESPSVTGPGGDIYARPPGMSTMPKEVTATGPDGKQIRLNPQTNQWEPLEGGQGSGSGGFL